MNSKKNLAIVFLLKNNAYNDPVDRLRGRDIVNALRKKGWNAEFFDEQTIIDILFVLDLDFKTCYIINRYPHKKLILDIQDDFFHKNNKSLAATNIKTPGKFKKLLELYRSGKFSSTLIILLHKFLTSWSAHHLIKRANYVITSSYSLANVLCGMNKNIITIPDSLDAALYCKAEKNIVSDKSSKIICWIGTPSNIKYLVLVNQALARLQTEFGITIRIISSKRMLTEKSLVDIASDFSFNYEFIEWKENTFVDELSKCDIGIAPLPYGIAKSSNKILSYMACGLAVVCSGSEDYRIIHERHPDALIYEDDHDKWYEHITTLLHSESDISSYKKNAITVANNFMLDTLVAEYESLLSSLVEDLG